MTGADLLYDKGKKNISTVSQRTLSYNCMSGSVWFKQEPAQRMTKMIGTERKSKKVMDGNKIKMTLTFFTIIKVIHNVLTSAYYFYLHAIM